MRVSRWRGAGCAVLIALGAAACERAAADGWARYEYGPPAGTPLLRSRVVSESDSLRLPTELQVTRDYLVALDRFGNPSMYVFRLADGALVGTLGKRGHGPGEFQGPWSVDVEPGTNRFWVYDLEASRLTRVDLDRWLAAGRVLAQPPVLNLRREQGPPTDLAWLGDSVMVGPGYYQSGRLARFGRDGKLRALTGQLPVGDVEGPPQVIQHAYQSTMELNPARTLVALGTRHASRLEILRPTGERVAVAEGPRPFGPVYSVATRAGSPVLLTDEKLRFGYVDLAATERHVIALYSGMRRGDRPGAAHFGRVLHVYDWSGRLLRQVVLDAEVLHVAADERTGTLYASRSIPGPAIVADPLGEITGG